MGGRLRAEILGMQDRAAMKAQANEARERRIVALLREGLTPRTIAERMGVSMTTVKTVRELLMKNSLIQKP